MKIGKAILAGIGIVLVAIAVGLVTNSGSEANNETLRVAFFPNIGHAIPVVGMERDTFEDNLGNATTIETKLFDSGPQVIESLYANSIDIAYVGPGPAINGFLKSENRDVVILSGAASGGASFIVHPDSEIISVEDFAGKRIAAPQIGNSQDVSLRNYLSENGLKSYEKGGSVIVLNIPNPDIYTLFTKGEIDGAWVPEPWATILVQELGGQRLFFEEELWPQEKFASVLLIGRQEYVQNNPEIISNWLESHEQTVNWINQNPQETRIIFNDFMQNHMGQSLSDSVIDEALGNLEITTDPVDESIYTFAARADSLGYLGRDGYSLDGIFFDIASNESLQENK
ncbi:MAG: ABC transporter substrate-binding protein [Nitrosopumilaceae archaeon]|jgi:NitT/TauT family transport system substrate-binding protein|uniref:ABC transporter substrate-binding protein n=2 Tax=Candidatus Nitrosomaritimum aestuariumsis TaxID=3342354 RepID=A0AC60W994_9ARCH|nr:ABC transporter substrate-binding protein [Nitrosopumilaceae archaeon]MBA4464187.1 ABC transporter substrate-binding protein [Nitrosopumilaceae archaeon]